MIKKKSIVTAWIRISLITLEKTLGSVCKINKINSFWSTYYVPDPNEGQKYSGGEYRQGLCFLTWLFIEV